MRRKNEGPCITFHLNPARRSPKAGPAGLPGLRTIPRKPNEIGFDTQTRGPAILKKPAQRPPRFAYDSPETQ